jgi:hypothetical protein
MQKKSNIFRHFKKVKSNFFANIYYSPFDSHYVLNIEARLWIPCNWTSGYWTFGDLDLGNWTPTNWMFSNWAFSTWMVFFLKPLLVAYFRPIDSQNGAGGVTNI